VKIELKRFTTNARLSQETTAFAADVWIDGKKAGYAENDGHGGATIVHLHFLDPSIRAKIDAHGKALVPAEFKSIASYEGAGTEWIVDQLVVAELEKRDAKAFAKKIANADTKEKAKCEKHGLRSARLRHGDTWLWFAFKPDADPKALADAIAAKQKARVDELVVLS
jgi:hypothetical protein